MAGTLLAPPSGTPLQRLVQMAMERGYTAQGEMFSGELGAEGSQAGHSLPGKDWRGWVAHCQVCGGPRSIPFTPSRAEYDK